MKIYVVVQSDWDITINCKAFEDKAEAQAFRVKTKKEDQSMSVTVEELELQLTEKL